MYISLSKIKESEGYQKFYRFSSAVWRHVSFGLDLRGTKITKLTLNELIQIHKVIVRKDQLEAKEIKRNSKNFEIEVR